MVATLRHAGVQDIAFVAQTLFATTKRSPQVGQVSATQIPQLDALQVVPQPFNRIELGRIAGQALQVQPLGGAACQEVFDGLTVMNRGAVPDDEQFAGDLAQEQPQEADDIGRVVGAVLRLQKDPSRWGERADGREVVMGQRDAQHWRLPAGRPRAHGQGQEVKARLIYPDDGALFCDRFFSSAGQRSCHHAWIASSLRCVARVRGRWTLWRTACKRRLTCAGW
jgi:hypothetical protein